MTHALAGGVVGLVVSIVGTAVNWNKGPSFRPHWYPLALIVLAMPCARAGGKLRETQLQERAAGKERNSIKKGQEALYAKNHPVPMVRRQGRRGDEFLCLCLQEFKNSEGYSIWRSRARTKGDGNVRDIPTRWTRLFRTQRRPVIHLHTAYIVLRELRDAARSARAVGKALPGRRKGKMRLAERQIWSVVANHSLCCREDAARQRCCKTKMLQDKDAEKAKRVMQAMLQMDKIDIERLKQAHDQG